MMDFWSIIAIIGGIAVAIIAVSLLLKYTGIGEFIGHILHLLGTFFQGAFSLLHSTIQAAPGPIRIIFFIVLFISVGGFVYESTIGLTHPCVSTPNGPKSYTVDVLTGMASIVIPKDLGKALYEPILIDRKVDVGPFKSDEAGNPYIVIPDKVAPNVDAITRGENIGGIGISSYTAWGKFVGLEYCLCVTSDNVCYLSDCNALDPVKGAVQRCDLRDDSGNYVVKGSIAYWIKIAYDPKIQTKFNGLDYQWTSPLDYLDRLPIIGKSDFMLDKCDASGGTRYPWLRNTSSLVIDATKIIQKGNLFYLQPSLEGFGKGIVFNALDVLLLQKQTEESAFYGKYTAYGVVISPSDPDYGKLQAAANNFDNFIKANGNLTEQGGIFTFSCNEESQYATLLFIGLPILSKNFMFVMVLVIIIFAVSGYIKKS